jgi:hypothetical protein
MPGRYDEQLALQLEDVRLCSHVSYWQQLMPWFCLQPTPASVTECNYNALHQVGGT